MKWRQGNCHSTEQLRRQSWASILRDFPEPPIQVNLELPPELGRMIGKASEKDRDLRYQSAAELRGDLKRLKRDSGSGRLAALAAVSDRDSSPTAPPSSQAIKRPAKGTGRWWALAASASIVVLAILAFLSNRPTSPPRVLRSVQITRDGRQKVSTNGMQMIVTDGSRLYFGESVAGGWGIAQVSAVGGETVPLATPFPNAALLGISAERSELLVQNITGDEQEPQLWAVPIPGGTPRRLGNIFAHDANWSPDGRQLIYANRNDLYLANADGTEPRKFLSLERFALIPRFSPDGHTIRFTMFGKSNSSPLWEVSRDGSDLHNLFAGDNPAFGVCGNWTADGRYFVFQGRSDIWAMREKIGLFGRRSAPVQLTTGPLDFLMPVPSLDGKRLFVIGVQQRGELLRYDSKSRQFETYLPGVWADELDFSKDGQWIAYIAWPEGRLWRSKRDGTERLQLTPRTANMPRWSPDGKQIAFVSSTPSKGLSINVISAQGGTPEELISGQPSAMDPVWSPDGNYVAFGANPWFNSRRSRSRSLVLPAAHCGRYPDLKNSIGPAGPRMDDVLRPSRGMPRG